MAPVDEKIRRQGTRPHEMSPPRQIEAITKSQAVKRLEMTQAMLDKACDQLLVLDRREYELQQRYLRAKSSGRLSFGYSLRLQLSTTAATKRQYYMAAERLAEVLKRLALQEGSKSPQGHQGQVEYAV